MSRRRIPSDSAIGMKPCASSIRSNTLKTRTISGLLRIPTPWSMVLPNKSLQARVGANPSLWDTLGYVHASYTTLLQILPSLEPTTVSIMSRVNTLFNWVETNAVVDEWYAHVSAAARLWVTDDGEFRQAPSAQFVNLLASPKQLRTHSDIASPAPSAALMMQVSASAGSGMAR